MKKKLIIIISSVALLLAIVAVVLIVVLVNNNPSNPDTSYRSIKIELKEGNVSINRNNEELDSYVNMNLRSGDTIVTKESSNAVLKLDEDKFVYIGEKSNVNLVSSEKDSSKTIIRVNEGSIVTEVKNKLSDLEEFNVETPNSTMAIRGTIFGVTVIKESGQIKIGYKLLEGNIELSVIEKTALGYNVGKFRMAPMEEINILSKGDGILEKESLSTALELINKQDSKVKVNEYQDVVEYISETDKIELVEKELEVSDVDDILRNIPTNVAENSIRLVTINATFSLFENEKPNGQFLMKYDSNESFEVLVRAISSNATFKGWLINGEFYEDENEFNYTVTKTTVIEAVFENTLPNTNGTSIIVETNNYANINVTYDADRTATVGANSSDGEFMALSYLSLSFEPIEPDLSLAFGGWYEETDDSIKLLSKDYEYTYQVTEEARVFPLLFTYSSDNAPEIGIDNTIVYTSDDEPYRFILNQEYEMFISVPGANNSGGVRVPIDSAVIGMIENPTEVENGKIKFTSLRDVEVTCYFLDANYEGEAACSFSFYASVVKNMATLFFNSLDTNTTFANYVISESGPNMTFEPGKPGTTPGMTSQIDDTEFSRQITLKASAQTIEFQVTGVNFEQYQIYRIDTTNGLAVGEEIQDLTSIELGDYEGIVIINTTGLPAMEYNGMLLSELGMYYEDVVLIIYGVE